MRALNVCGVIALERGGLSEATRFFTQAQEAATQDGDMIAVGRCANNLGAIANMQGDHARAVGAHTRALAAFRQAGCDRGIVEALHNLAIAYREQRDLDHAMEAADAAVREAEVLGDRLLKAQAIAGRAEVQTARGDPAVAIRDAETALAMHREFEDVVRETEDQRILGVALGVAGKSEEAEDRLRDVITRAGEHRRPLLAAIAHRDLAHVRARRGDVAGATDAAQTARGMLERLGAKGEVAKLDAFLGRSLTSA